MCSQSCACPIFDLRVSCISVSCDQSEVAIERALAPCQPVLFASATPNFTVSNLWCHIFLVVLLLRCRCWRVLRLSKLPRGW